MKKLLSVTTFLIGTFLLFSSIVGASGKTYDEEEITQPIKTATTAEDHMKIAEYFDKQAEEAETNSGFHTSMAKAYRERSKPLEGLAKHCSGIAKRYEEDAEDYKTMANEHRKMAEQIQNK
jgi:DNA-binding ferritin-like protein